MKLTVKVTVFGLFKFLLVLAVSARLARVPAWWKTRGPGCGKCGARWKTRALVKNTGCGGKHGVPFFSPNCEFSSLKWEAEIFVSLYCDEYQFSISSLKRVARSKKQIKHFVRKKTIQEPTCRALVFFRGVYFIFHSNVRVIFTFKKEIMNVLTASFIWETFFQKVIQRGYDGNPWITVRFGTSANHRIPFMTLHVQCSHSIHKSICDMRGPFV